ncbi:hypothetical protein O181_068972 [Austropuccinia psidii MF-1]|uniref:Uncharacterized protein n=1 Tax=Austropuccinia psidii MF-1 TaxID=1389203 RepID=A0A9Q3I6T7_9BASI|nr:hypothetical protein [Austropuccinia psidii MF-1]
MGFKCQKQNPLNPPQQDFPVPSLPRKQTPQKPTPGPSGTRWSEELLCEPSQTKEPPSPAPNSSSKPPEDVLTCEPEPEVAQMQFMEEPFARPATPRSIIIIDNMPVGSPPPPPLQPRFSSQRSLPVQSPSHSHDDARQEFTGLRPTLMIPQAIIHKSCWRIATCST